jgi:DNA repair exonuclease SbcCD ATPase subunit
MMIELPTKDGIMNFLFMGEDGLKLVDTIVPGFSYVMDLMKSKTTFLSDKAKELEKKIADSKIRINNNNINKQKKQNEIVNEIILNDAVLNDKPINTNIDNLIQIHNTNIEQLKLNNSETPSVMIQLEELCNKITDLNITKDNNDLKYNQLKNLTPEELNNNINNLKNELNELNDIYNNDTINKQMANDKKELDDIKKNNADFNICKLRENPKILDKLLKSILNDEESKINPNEEKLKNLNNQIENIQNDIDKLEKFDQSKLNKLNDLLSKTNAQINDLKIDLCNNQNNMSSQEYSDKMSQLQILENLSQITKNRIDISDINDVDRDNKINNLKSKLENISKEQKNIKNDKENFDIDKKLKMEQIKNVTDNMATIFNVICSTPKVIANIFVGLFNSVGYMKYLPSLWEFPYIE